MIISKTILDVDGDDWINYRETGAILQGMCLQQESKRSCIREIFDQCKQNQTSTNSITFIDLQQLESKYEFQFARQLMQEADVYQNGSLTYWDLYIHRNIYLMQRLCEIIIQRKNAQNNQEQ